MWYDVIYIYIYIYDAYDDDDDDGGGGGDGDGDGDDGGGGIVSLHERTSSSPWVLKKAQQVQMQMWETKAS